MAGGSQKAIQSHLRVPQGHTRCMAMPTGGIIEGRVTEGEGDRRAIGYAVRGQGLVREAWVGNRNTFHTALMRAMVCSEAHSRSRITQLLRFMRPATCSSSRRYFSKRAVRSSGLKHRPLIALAML